MMLIVRSPYIFLIYSPYMPHNHHNTTNPTSTNIAKKTPITQDNLFKELIQDITKCAHNINDIIEGITTQHTPLTTADNHDTTTWSICTWNTCQISSNLLGIKEFLHAQHNDPQTTLIQKLNSTKSITYIVLRFPYNKSHTTTPTSLSHVATINSQHAPW